MCFCGFAVAIVKSRLVVVVVVIVAATFMSLRESPLTKHNDVSCAS